MLHQPEKRKRFRILRRLFRPAARLALLLAIFFGLGAASAPPQHALPVQVNRVTAAYRFDFVDWESWAIAGELRRRWRPPALPPNSAGQRQLVETYLYYEQRRNEIEAELNRLVAQPGNRNRQRLNRLEQELARLKTAQAKIIPRVETILSRQVEAVLQAEGLTTAGYVFPPVAFRFTDPPTALILSPRDRIENRQSVNLQPGLSIAEREKIERTLDRRGDISSYVTNIGGLGSYPTMVVNHPWLPALIEIIAHEWTHNYFYTFPSNIAWGYQTYPRLTTINETTADLVGQEISRKVITRFYPAWVNRLPALDETGQPAPRAPSEFDLAMRRIRLHVDRLLAAGRIEEAEAYMEAERVKLVEKGYTLRKLNQAYFAFHGSYALSPASTDPTGRQLRHLRAASPSLKQFLNRVGRLNSYNNFLDWLREAGLEETAP